MKRTAIALLAAAFWAAVPLPAAAQGAACGPRQAVLDGITGPPHHEVPMVELSVNGTEAAKLLLYTNLATGTWTLIGFPQPLIACLMAAGKNIKILPGVPKPETPET